jgi:uncharacterized protein YggE
MTFKPLLLAALLCIGAAPAIAQDAGAPFDATTLNLSATGEIQATPDLAAISLGVQTQAPTATEALRLNRVKMTATIAALRAQGLKEKDIQTTGLNLNAQYVFHEGEPSRLTGYQASNLVTIRVHDLAKLGATVDAVVAAGANQVNGITFSLADPQAAQDDARREAIKTLQAKDALYAAAMGYRVERLVSLSDTVGSNNIVRPMMAMRAMATPAEPGELTVTATVGAVYELKK